MGYLVRYWFVWGTWVNAKVGDVLAELICCCTHLDSGFALGPGVLSGTGIREDLGHYLGPYTFVVSPDFVIGTLIRTFRALGCYLCVRWN